MELFSGELPKLYKGLHLISFLTRRNKWDKKNLFVLFILLYLLTSSPIFLPLVCSEYPCVLCSMFSLTSCVRYSVTELIALLIFSTSAVSTTTVHSPPHKYSPSRLQHSPDGTLHPLSQWAESYWPNWEYLQETCRLRGIYSMENDKSWVWLR